MKKPVSSFRGWRVSERLKNYFERYLCLFRQFSVLVPSSLAHSVSVSGGIVIWISSHKTENHWNIFGLSSCSPSDPICFVFFLTAFYVDSISEIRKFVQSCERCFAIVFRTENLMRYLYSFAFYDGNLHEGNFSFSRVIFTSTAEPSTCC